MLKQLPVLAELALPWPVPASEEERAELLSLHAFFAAELPGVAISPPPRMGSSAGCGSVHGGQGGGGWRSSFSGEGGGSRHLDCSGSESDSSGSED